MNYSVHAIMYTYFALTAIARYRAKVFRVAPLITALQISQFAWGTVINIIAAVAFSSRLRNSMELHVHFGGSWASGCGQNAAHMLKFNLQFSHSCFLVCKFSS